MVKIECLLIYEFLFSQIFFLGLWSIVLQSDQMAEGGAQSRYVKLTKDQAPLEDIKPGELNQPIDVPQVHPTSLSLSLSIYIYIYVCVCV